MPVKQPFPNGFFYTGVSHKIGEVHEGEAIMDWMEQEKRELPSPPRPPLVFGRRHIFKNAQDEAQKQKLNKKTSIELTLLTLRNILILRLKFSAH